MDYYINVSEKGLADIIAGGFLLYIVFASIVGALFTLMLLFGTPVEQG